MKKMKWLRKLPIFALALIIAVSPLMMAVPVRADVLVSEDYAFRVDLGNTSVLMAVPSFFVPYLDLNTYEIYLSVEEDFSVFLSAYVKGTFPGFGTVLGEAGIWALSADFCTYADGSGQEITSEVIFFDWSIITSGLPRAVPTSFFFLADFPLSSSYLDPNHVYEGFLSTMELVEIKGDAVGVLSVFSGVGSWLSGAIGSMSEMFWTAESGMTVLGYLAVASLALAVILLIFSLIAGWLKFH